MILAQPSLISKIDKFAADSLGIPARTLMERAGRAVAEAVRSYVKRGSRISIFSGKGNNGGDGYAAAFDLMTDYDVCVYDVFASGQRTDEGKHFLSAYSAAGGSIDPLTFDGAQMDFITSSDCLVDAVFGTGFSGEMPDEAARLAEVFSSQSASIIIAVDVPLGVNAADGSVREDASYHATATVSLGFIKHGLVSYPAREYVGRLIHDNIGLHNEQIISEFDLSDHYIDYELASALIPNRAENSSKGSFGRALVITGSSEYPGAAHLSLEAALRGGVGLVTYLGEGSLCDSLSMKHPEAIYKRTAPIRDLTDGDCDGIAQLSASHGCTLIGSGSSRSAGLRALLCRLLADDGSPIILDADAVNVLSEDSEEGRSLIARSPRTVILTPHPLELSRISGIPTDDVQAGRLSVAKSFALENKCILVLKGAGTLITDGVTVYINSSGSSALAKAGSGDVLAGLIASLVAGGLDPLRASALAVYFHGLAGDVLEQGLSPFGVTPSDLPREIGRQLAIAMGRRGH